MPRRGKLVDDSEWKEVEIGNRYALLIGYLSMAVKGLGFLVLTWTTVVLLGGFVSTLKKKDFWCLTIITLVQTAGIFDVLLTEKLIYIWESLRAVASVRYAVLGDKHLWRKCQLLATSVAAVQLVVFGILLCPLAAVYLFGLLISAGISVWRLRKHDYGSDADGLGNLKPALDVLYSLALLQGVIFCYKTIYGFAKSFVVNSVLRKRGFCDQSRVGISDYLLEMTTGCEKDTLFARGRNLITYAVELMSSKSPDDYISGVGILDSFAAKMEAVYREWEEYAVYPPSVLKRFMQESILTKHLIMSASSSDILQKLLQTLASQTIYDRETRGKAARIVANIAGSIRLEEFPGGVCFISSLLGTFESYSAIQPYKLNWLKETFERDWFKAAPDLDDDDDEREDSDGDLQNTYKELVVQGLRILRKLAIDIDNCRVMLDHPYLLQKIMAPVTSDLLHHIDHGVWSSIVEGSLRVMAQLTAATGQTGTKLRTEISSSKDGISTMERILECDRCNEMLRKQVILIFTHLYEDTSLSLETASRNRFIEMLVNIMTDDTKDKEARRVTANALVVLSFKIETSATIIMKANANVVDNLTMMIVQNHPCRLSAVQILRYLCIYTDDDESLKKLKKAMTDAIPKLLEELLCWATEEKHTRTEVGQISLTKPGTDIENQRGNSQDNVRANKSTSSPHQRDYKLSEYAVICILSLCATVCDRLIGADQDLAHQFDATTLRDGAVSLPMKLKWILEKSMHPKPDSLTIVKLTCKIVISMMNHRATYAKEDLERLMDALSSASKEMFLLDGSIVFDIRDHNTTASQRFRSLASLVKEAPELVDKHLAGSYAL